MVLLASKRFINDTLQLQFPIKVLNVVCLKVLFNLRSYEIQNEEFGFQSTISLLDTDIACLHMTVTIDVQLIYFEDSRQDVLPHEQCLRISFQYLHRPIWTLRFQSKLYQIEWEEVNLARSRQIFNQDLKQVIKVLKKIMILKSLKSTIKM